MGLRVRSIDAGGIQTQRISFLGGEKTQRFFSRLGVSLEPEEDMHPAVAALITSHVAALRADAVA